ncbi:hypothetical protein [Enterococcus faecium]|nr:hypothetical protein [Enterococcus faecium]MCJ9718861.1 hypothetical protein [Enterococcus faecium]
MNKVIYQLTTEDVSHFLTNKKHYIDTEEIQNELDRKRMPYQRFERKKGK